ncbi:MAG: hypothetical protein A2X58_07060 [Nitrospirae bacterium GWC2_56_14]|nr:MAG: hypothetical protein A2X58_07060 [Nitrospirae bacterium GWC2_56_14]
MTGKNKIITLTVALVVACAAIAGAFSLPGIGKADKVKGVNGVVTIPAAKVSDGKAHFFKYSDGRKDITFFAVKGPDGSIRTAFDACDACYREKKGYEQQGKVMVCKNCNMKFPINRMGPNMTGGCNPSYLPHQLSGDAITVKTSDLNAGARFF